MVFSFDGDLARNVNSVLQTEQFFIELKLQHPDNVVVLLVFFLLSSGKKREQGTIRGVGVRVVGGCAR